MFATVNTKKNSLGNKDSVISKREARTASEACTGSGPSIWFFQDHCWKQRHNPNFKPQDNNASFEGISEAEYNKRHMKALKDADPGLKLQASSFKRQAFEPT